MAHYLVTGSAGFIGAKVTELLLADGHRVTGVDNLNNAYDVRLKEWRGNSLKGQEGYEFHNLDICDPQGLKQVFSTGLDGVINLAARSGVRQSVTDPWVYFETNLTGTLNLLELCRIFEVPKLVLASTSSLYGATNPQPFKEDADTSTPLSPYAASKKAAEAFCYTYHYLHGLDITVVRYFTVYGPAGRPDMSVFRFIRWIAEGEKVQLNGLISAISVDLSTGMKDSFLVVYDRTGAGSHKLRKDRVDRTEDRGATAEVTLQGDGQAVGIRAVKLAKPLGEDRRIRQTEAIDALLDVADHEQIVAAIGDRFSTG